MKVFFALLVACYVVGTWSLPLGQVETDPELTSGHFEGDIVLDGDSRNGLRDESYRWPDAKVYYRFHDGISSEHRNHVLRGMQIIEDVSCIRFEEANATSTAFVNITTMAGGCYSSVGYRSNIRSYNLQVYPLDTGCFRMGTVVHEFLHTLGFYHMQSASNRDEYVRIAEENITPTSLHNFNLYSEDVVDDFDEEYDYASVLHYSAYAFSANGEMTIIPLKDEEAWKDMGQRRGMTKSDIRKLNLMYRCPVGI